MAAEPAGKMIAILVADEFEQRDLSEPKSGLEKAGAATEIVSPCKSEVLGLKRQGLERFVSS